MRFCELEIGLQKKLNNANYHDSSEIRNIVNSALAVTRNNTEFKTEFCCKIGILLDDIKEIINDILGSTNTELQSEKENQLPPNEL